MHRPIVVLVPRLTLKQNLLFELLKHPTRFRTYWAVWNEEDAQRAAGQDDWRAVNDQPWDAVGNVTKRACAPPLASGRSCEDRVKDILSKNVPTPESRWQIC